VSPPIQTERGYSFACLADRVSAPSVKAGASGASGAASASPTSHQRRPPNPAKVVTKGLSASTTLLGCSLANRPGVALTRHDLHRRAWIKPLEGVIGFDCRVARRQYPCIEESAGYPSPSDAEPSGWRSSTGGTATPSASSATVPDGSPTTDSERPPGPPIRRSNALLPATSRGKTCLSQRLRRGQSQAPPR